MNGNDGTRLFLELTLGNRIPCHLQWDGKRHMIIVPLFALRGGTLRHTATRPSDMRDLNEEEMGIVMGMAIKSKLICETHRSQGVMTIW